MRDSIRQGVRRLLPLLLLGAGLTWLPVAPSRAADTGSITGIVDKGDQVTAVTAIDRQTDKKYPGEVDKKTGRFTIAGLPLEGAYDCVIDFGGVRLEGVNLKVPHSDYEQEQPLPKEDVKTIKETALSLNVFEDKVEVLTVTGNIQHAAVVLNKVRTQPFINSKPGEIIWRLELWHFQKPEETWIKDQDELFSILYRERIPKTEFDKKSLTLDPALGGVQVTAKAPMVDLGRVAMPAKEAGIRLRSAEANRPAPGR